MKKFMFGIKIKGKKFSCSGNQLVEILQIVNDPAVGSWYCDDVEANKKDSDELIININKVNRIGSTKDFIKFSYEVSQFYSGVFVYVDKNYKLSKLNDMDTEENQFENFNNEILQIRAFDTSYFEIYSNDKELLMRIMDEFGPLASII
jgi:hypothetical protein